MNKEKLNEFITYVNSKNNKLEAFKSFAKDNGYKYSSLRNLYYKSLKNYDVKIKKYDKFCEADTKILIEKINDNLAKGISVRKTCLDLANNNISLMVRLQNKYRNVVYKSYYKKRKINTEVLNFEAPKKKITEDDINSLFLGLIKLVKNRAIKEYKESYNLEIETLKMKIRNLKKDLSDKDLLINSLYKKVENTTEIVK